MFNVVVLPHPDGPSRTNNSPSRISRLRLRTAWNDSNFLSISTNRIEAGRTSERGDSPEPGEESGSVVVTVHPLPRTKSSERIDQIQATNSALEEIGQHRRRDNPDDRSGRHLGRH